jgi:hypothetical protein
MSFLLFRYRGSGILAGLMGLVKKAALGGEYHQLERGLMVLPEDLPSSFCSSEVAILGRARAAEMAVNVLLPFACAWGEAASQPQLKNGAEELYQNYPGLMANSVERHMRSQLGIPGGIIKSAGQQQGLLRIYKTLCIRGACGRCPLGDPAPEMPARPSRS